MPEWHAIPRFLIHRAIRNRAKIHEFPLNRFVVRLAHTVADYESAFKLLHVAYAYQGIESVRDSSMRVTPQHVLPETLVLLAYEGDKIVGTMSLTPDSPAGLPLDKDYPAELQRLRGRCRKLAEYGSLAVTKRYWHTGATTILNMAATRIALHVFAASHVVIGIHPKATTFYQAIYDFEPFAPPRPHAELAAPVIGMRQCLATLPAYLARRYPRPTASGYTVAEHFNNEPLSCIELPARLAPGNLSDWRMSRSVFQELFFAKTDRLKTLEPHIRHYLEQRRSRETLTTPSLGAQCLYTWVA